MGFERFMTKHFGGVPRSFKDLEWIYRVRPSDPAIVPAAHEYRTVSPGSQPNFARPNVEKINKNYYYTRDVRRAYPATAVYSTEDIAKIVGASQARIGSGSPESNVAVNALPPAAPGIKHVYESALPHLGPSDLNPDLHIRGVK
ncbi:hypothetical protein BJ741DRAFT_620034 [Chytriomyces cf. hyalinus JEL632]|nr:hypothetical protein BJ741DRAFT_620034 [Chytriomyces cf. hyalinus JEL632]